MPDFFMSRGPKRGAAPRSRLFVVQCSRGFVREVVPVALDDRPALALVAAGWEARCCMALCILAPEGGGVVL
jgi:hypothetical protein